MIAVFPDLYPDELVYSCLARYAVRSGYMVYRAVAEDILLRKNDHPSTEFLNPMTDDALSKFKVTLPELIHRNTMFDYYAQFMNCSKRTEVYNALLSGNMKVFGNSISLRHNGKERYLRYCPICARHDRETYGETYWHRCHQMPEVPICPIHHTRFRVSSVTSAADSSPAYVSAEETIPQTDPSEGCEEPMSVRIAEYCYRVFEHGYNEDCTVSYSDFLNAKMEYTRYRSPRGEIKSLTRLHDDLRAFYPESVLHGFSEKWQLTKLLCGDRHNLYEICLVAMFLGISEQELFEMSLPSVSQQDAIDRQVHELREQGVSFSEISRRLGVSVNVIKPISTGAYFHRYDNRTVNPRKSKVKSIDWNSLDRDKLPLVEKYISETLSSAELRPVRISCTGAARYIGVKDHQIKNLRLCTEAVRTHRESNERYMARCVVWAYGQLRHNGEAITVTSFRRVLNCKRKAMLSSIEYLREYADEKTAEQIIGIILQ